MDKTQGLRITFNQQNAEEIATIKRIFEEELGAPVYETKQTTQNSEPTKSPDWAAMAAVILAVPATALAIKDLTDRLKRKKQVDKALERVRKEVKTTTNRVTFTYPDGTVKTVENVTTTEILEQFDQSDL